MSTMTEAEIDERYPTLSSLIDAVDARVEPMLEMIDKTKGDTAAWRVWIEQIKAALPLIRAEIAARAAEACEQAHKAFLKQAADHEKWLTAKLTPEKPKARRKRKS